MDWIQFLSEFTFFSFIIYNNYKLITTLFRRVSEEGILLTYDFHKTVEIVNEIFTNLAKLESDTNDNKRNRRRRRKKVKVLNDASEMYLKRKYRTIQRSNPNTYTEVYINNILQLVESIKSKIIKFSFNWKS